ncbi:Tex1p LALA0_S11e02630g [Lachancea lanzarotensis]|uniref:LALA0S11e02630g1_1 n=1 Tax=Lachancea lanzarotensis TaxID=1245769 RepID=A0A0C7NDG0_9SACH|nr:uncharacterized protein LALA0_S11e02630g [Lachancea lanzarotensis]CEP64374.1 LALA0S11e02630g1_1 [Lachancea lanzarotensis]
MTASISIPNTLSTHHSKVFAKFEKNVLPDQHFSQVSSRTSSKSTEFTDNPKTPVGSLEFHPTGAYVVYTRLDGTLNMWKLKSDRAEDYKPLTLDLANDSIGFSKSCVSWSPFTGFLFAMVDGSSAIRIFDASTGANIKTLHSDDDDRYNVCTYDPNGKWLATVTQNNQVLLFDVDADYQLAWRSPLLRSANTTQSIPAPAKELSSYHTTSLIWSHDSSKIYAAFDSGEIRIYDVLAAGLQELIHVSGHTGPVNCLRLTQTGSYLLAAGEDTVCSIWDLSSMCCVFTINDFPDSIRDMDISHGESVIALSSPSCIQIYALETRESIYKVEFNSLISGPKFRFYPGRLTFISTTDNDLVTKFHRPEPTEEFTGNGATDKKPRPDRRPGIGGRRRDADAPPRSRFVRRSARR